LCLSFCVQYYAHESVNVFLTHLAEMEMLLSLPRQPRQHQTICNICTSRPKPVTGLKPKLIWTNGTRPSGWFGCLLPHSVRKGGGLILYGMENHSQMWLVKPLCFEKTSPLTEGRDIHMDQKDEPQNENIESGHPAHRRTQDFTMKGAHRGGSGNFQKRAKPWRLGMEVPQWDAGTKPHQGVWGTKFPRSWSKMWNYVQLYKSFPVQNLGFSDYRSRAWTVFCAEHTFKKFRKIQWGDWNPLTHPLGTPLSSPSHRYRRHWTNDNCAHEPSSSLLSPSHKLHISHHCP